MKKLNIVGCIGSVEIQIGIWKVGVDLWNTIRSNISSRGPFVREKCICNDPFTLVVFRLAIFMSNVYLLPVILQVIFVTM